MSVSACIEVFISNEFKGQMEALLNLNDFEIEGEQTSNKGTSLHLGEMNLNYADQIAQDMLEAKILGSIYVSGISDEAIENYMIDVHCLNGEIEINQISNSGQRVVNELKEIIKFMQGDKSKEEIEAYINQRIIIMD